MRVKLFNLFISLIFVSQSVTYAQEYNELLNQYKICNTDTGKARLLADMSDVSEAEILDSLCDALISFCDNGLETNKNNPLIVERFTMQKVRGVENKGFYLMDEGKTIEAMDMYQKALLILQTVKAKTLEVEKRKANIENNLATAYIKIKEYQKALDLFPYFISLHIKTNELRLLSIDYNNLGTIYGKLGKTDSSLLYILKSIALRKQLKVPEVQLITPYRNAGTIYLEKENIDSAKLYLTTALNWSLKYNDERTLSPSCFYYGRLMLKLNNNNEALKYYKLALQYADKGNVTMNYRDAYQGLYNIYTKLNKPKEALECYVKYRDYSDSVYSSKLKEESTVKDLNFKHEQDKMLQNAEFDKKMAIENERSERRKKVIVYAVVALVVCLLLIGVIVWRWRITMKQKHTIESQRAQLHDRQNKLILSSKEIELKNKMIHDNISYAYNIQNGLLPSYEEIKKVVDSSILFLPCDIVSGDFYNYYTEGNKNIYVLGDCTGHGVSGAFISLLVIKSLDKIINTKSYNSLDDIIRKLNIELHNSFKKGDSGLYGVDLVVMQVDPIAQTVCFTGSASKFAYVDSESKFSYLKFKNLEIGKYEEINSEIEQMQFKISEVKEVYLFSDGIIDQKGGSDNKKFGSNNLQSLLTSLSGLDSIDQMRRIRDKFKEWKGDREQMDDVSVWIFNNVCDTKVSDLKSEASFNKYHHLSNHINNYAKDYVQSFATDPAFIHVGNMNYEVMNSHLSDLKAYLESNFSELSFRKRVYSLLVESLDNIYRHGFHFHDDENNKVIQSYFVLCMIEDNLVLRFGNYLDKSSGLKHKERWEQVSSTSKNQLNENIKEQVLRVSQTDASGAGIGFMDIMRKFMDKALINAYFEEFNDELFLYSLEIRIPK